MTRVPPSRAELLAAVENPNPNNPLCRAIAAAIAGYANMLADQADRANAVPDPLVLPMAQSELEVFALELFIADIRALNLRVVFEGSEDVCQQDQSA